MLDTVPPGMTFVTQNYDFGDPPSSCNFGATIDCSTGVLALAATFGVTLTFHVNPADTDGMVITNTATASSDTPDPNLANNSSIFHSAVDHRALLAFPTPRPAAVDVNTDVV